MTLWQSRDDGRTWPRENALVVYTHDEQALLTQGKENINFKQYWEDMAKWSFGHPAIRPLPDGRLLLAHYAGTPDCMSVLWVRVNPEEVRRLRATGCWLQPEKVNRFRSPDRGRADKTSWAIESAKIGRCELEFLQTLTTTSTTCGGPCAIQSGELRSRCFCRRPGFSDGRAGAAEAALQGVGMLWGQ